MKENTHSNPQILSHRAQEFIDSPAHHSLKDSIDQGWTIALEESSDDFLSDKFLTLSHGTSPEAVLDRLISEALARMCISRTILFSLKLSFRELENFLRDQNHLPVFNSEEVILAEEGMKKVKNSLLSACLIFKLENFIETFWDNKSDNLGWESLSLVQKNSQASLIISTINKLFSRGKMPELALARDSEISVLLHEFPFPIESIELVFRAIYRGSFDKTSFKVVAVQ